jgi:integration host factor subunit beta
MTKSQLVDRISERAPQLPRRELERIVNTVFESMVDALRREQRIEIRGFGSFAVKVRGARRARNPRTGQAVQVPRRVSPYFTAGKELRERLNVPPARLELGRGHDELSEPQRVAG